MSILFAALGADGLVLCFMLAMSLHAYRSLPPDALIEVVDRDGRRRKTPKKEALLQYMLFGGTSCAGMAVSVIVIAAGRRPPSTAGAIVTSAIWGLGLLVCLAVLQWAIAAARRAYGAGVAGG